MECAFYKDKEYRDMWNKRSTNTIPGRIDEMQLNHIKWSRKWPDMKRFKKENYTYAIITSQKEGQSKYEITGCR